MIRFRYENAFETRIRPCKECRKYNGCIYHIHKISPEAGECMYGEFEYKHPEATTKNVDWLIFQILRSIMLSKLGADTLLRDLRMNCTQPESLKDNNLKSGPSVTECYAFKIALTEFSNYIKERRDFFTKERRDTTVKRMSFADSIKNTYIEVNHDEVKICINNSEAMLRIQDKVKSEKYSFKVIDNEEMKECLAQPMNEN